MIPIIDRPMIHYVVEEAVASGIEQVIFVLSPGKKIIEDYFNRNLDLENFLTRNGREDDYKIVRDIADMVEVTSVIQEKQLGLGHAILCAEDVVGKDHFAVLLGDEIIVSPGKTATGQLIDAFTHHEDTSIIGVREIPKEDTHRYGIVEGKNGPYGKSFLMAGMVERPSPENAPSNLASPGRYIFSTEIFKYLKKIERGIKGEYQLTDAINVMAKTEKVYAHLVEGERYDTGNILGHLDAVVSFALQRKETKEVLVRRMENL